MGYRYGPVVAGVDGSADSIGALRWAADEACRHTRELVAVHVLPAAAQPSDYPHDTADVAAQAATEAQRWLPGVCATGVTETGSAAEVLRRYSKQARLVVLASRGSSNNLDKPLGSVSDALCVRAECPVLIVHAAQRWTDPFAALPHTGPVVVGFNGSGSARRALRLGFEEAGSRSRRLVVIQVWQHPQLWQPGHRHCADLTAEESAVHEALRVAAAPWQAQFPLVEMELRSEPGDAVEALSVASQWAMLMVLGTRCPTDTVQPPNPSVMRRVLRHMACPVLVAHGPSQKAATNLASAAAGPEPT
jgi:nucleotide-binding universal stress UspA family protein